MKTRRRSRSRRASRARGASLGRSAPRPKKRRRSTRRPTGRRRASRRAPAPRSPCPRSATSAARPARPASRDRRPPRSVRPPGNRRSRPADPRSPRRRMGTLQIRPRSVSLARKSRRSPRAVLPCPAQRRQAMVKAPGKVMACACCSRRRFLAGSRRPGPRAPRRARRGRRRPGREDPHPRGVRPARAGPAGTGLAQQGLRLPAGHPRSSNAQFLAAARPFSEPPCPGHRAGRRRRGSWSRTRPPRRTATSSTR